MEKKELDNKGVRDIRFTSYQTDHIRSDQVCRLRLRTVCLLGIMLCVVDSGFDLLLLVRR